MGNHALLNSNSPIQKRLRAILKIMLTTGMLLLTTACSLDEVKRFAYETGNNYACNEHEPNLPEKVRECEENALSYEEYKAARDETLSSD
jgi:hypothetical protein